MSADAKVANYFLGKAARTIEISPFTPNEMVQAYIEEFGSTYPFEERGLNLLARYSRGIFRRFLRYIQICLDSKLTDKTFELSESTVEKLLPMEEMASDWELELRQIFPRGSYWKIAFAVLIILVNAPKTASELSNEIESQGEDSIPGQGQHVRSFADRREARRVRLRQAVEYRAGEDHHSQPLNRRCPSRRLSRSSFRTGFSSFRGCSGNSSRNLRESAGTTYGSSRGNRRQIRTRALWQQLKTPLQ